MLKTMTVRATLAALACAISFSAHALADAPRKISIPAGDLRQGLLQLSKEYGVELVYQPEAVSPYRTQGVRGTYEAKDAVRLLLKGTPLELRTDPSGAMLIAPPMANTTSTDHPQPTGGENAAKEGKKDSSGAFLLAQATPGQTAVPATVDSQEEQLQKKTPQVQEIVVTGSRIPTATKETAQDVKVYTREQIDQSGESSVSDFLNTLSSVSVSVGENGSQTFLGSTTVQLRGLPFGTTLVLINGRRVQTSGLQGVNDFFDLNSIPLAAVERIEVLADGSSAVYGSDAIAGVVNIVLKENFAGLEASAKYASARDTGQTDVSIAWGDRWERGSFSVVGSLLTRDELSYGDRALTASNDYSALGGLDNNFPSCNPGNVFSVTGGNLPGLTAPFAGVPAGFTGTPTVQEFQATAGRLNECSINSGASLIPKTDRYGVFAHGQYELTPAVQLFTELMYSRVKQFQNFGPQVLFAIPGFQAYTESASNPFNPFGTPVGIGYAFTGIPNTGQHADTAFYRPLVGVRGQLPGTWYWEISAWDSEDHTDESDPLALTNSTAIQNALNSSNPMTAFNPMSTGSPSPALLNSFFSTGLRKWMGREEAVSGFVRGSLFLLPAGPIQIVAGSEGSRDMLSSDDISGEIYPPNTRQSFHRSYSAAFVEARIPIIASHGEPETGEALAVTVAGRHDDYSDFGGKNIPQVGLEWWPLSTLLIRGSYARAFKAPSLYELFSPQTISPNAAVFDPVTGSQEVVTLVNGGNPKLNPQTGESRSFGFVYSSAGMSGLRLSVTDWKVSEKAAIQNLAAQVIVNNESLFPGAVVRASSCAGGQPCPISEVFDTFINFGAIDVAGVDYQVQYQTTTAFGVWTPSLNASETYQYDSTFTPGTPAMSGDSRALDSGNWAPRWKGTLALGWRLSSYSANVMGRYVGEYQDYDSARKIGNFWLCDANFHWDIGRTSANKDQWLKGAYLDVGGVNVFNRSPQFSNYLGDFLGYDPAQADIRGRFLYIKVGAKL